MARASLLTFLLLTMLPSCQSTERPDTQIERIAKQADADQKAADAAAALSPEDADKFSAMAETVITASVISIILSLDDSRLSQENRDKSMLAIRDFLNDQGKPCSSVLAVHTSKSENKSEITCSVSFRSGKYILDLKSGQLQ